MNKHIFVNQVARASSLGIAAALLVSPSFAYAVDLKPHRVGVYDVTTLVTSTFGYGDNVFRGSENEVGSGFVSVKPLIQATKETSDHRLVFEYEGDGVAFFESSDDSYLSTTLGADYLRKLTSTSEFGIGASYQDGNNIRGTDITEGTNGDVEGATEFSRKDLSLDYRVGSEKVGPSFELGYEFTDLEFDNFQEINQGRDYQLDKFSARLGYQYSVATNFFVELSQSDFDYDEQAIAFGGELDNSEQQLLVGVKWRLSRLTSGEISIGTTDKEFDNFQDPSSLTTWNVQIEWTPTSRDRVVVEGFSRPFEQAGTGLFQDVDQASVEWEHDLSKTLSVRGSLTLGSVDFDDVARDDDFDLIGLGIIYKPSRYSELSLEYEYEDKESNISQFDFNTNTLFLSYSLSL